MRKLELVGQRFERLVVIKDVGRTPRKQVLWECQCDCGNIKVILGAKLMNQHTRSCGCLHRDLLRVKLTTHKGTGTRLYTKWRSIKSRCYMPSNPSYRDYGARGIKVSERWQIFENFRDDYALLPGQGDSIDRIDNNGDYSFENCRLTTKTVQNFNTRRSNTLLLKIAPYRILFMSGLTKKGASIELGITINQTYTLHRLAFEHPTLKQHTAEDLFKMSKREIENLLELCG